MAVPKIRHADDEPDDPGRERVDWTQADSVKPQAVPWLLPGRIPANGISLVEGHMGSGKSTLLGHLAAIVTKGKPWLGRKKQKPGGVLWLAAEEDSASDVVPRLVAAGADLARVHFAPLNEHGLPTPIRLPGSLTTLRHAIESLGLALLILDPLVSYIDSTVDLHSETAVRAVLDPVHALAASTRCAVIGTRHLRKDASGPRIHHGLGSVAIGSTARAILQVEQPEQDVDRRILRGVRISRVRLPPALEFYLVGDDGAVRVGKCRELTAAEDTEATATTDPVERDAMRDAETLLRRLLATEWVSAAAVLREAQSAQVGERTLRGAKVRLKVRSRRVGTATPPHWEWGPPEGGWK